MQIYGVIISLVLPLMWFFFKISSLEIKLYIVVIFKEDLSFAWKFIVVVAFNILIDKIKSIVKKLDCKSDRSASDEVLILEFQTGSDNLLKLYSKCNYRCIVYH